MIFGKRYYKEFLNSEEKIATNILADRLHMLEREGFVVKHTDEKQRSKYVYSPTEKGVDLLPVLLEMVLWSAKYDPNTAAPPAFIERLKEDRKGVMDEIFNRIKQASKEGT